MWHYIIIYVMVCVVYIYQNGYTPLMISVDNGNLEMSKLLIDNGAIISINTYKVKCDIYVKAPSRLLILYL
jgi:ankyrin repeat protein